MKSREQNCSYILEINFFDMIFINLFYFAVEIKWFWRCLEIICSIEKNKKYCKMYPDSQTENHEENHGDENEIFPEENSESTDVENKVYFSLCNIIRRTNT